MGVDTLTPDIDRAALRATEILIDYNIHSTPIAPLPILESMPGVFVVSFTEMAAETGLDRNHLVMNFGAENQDAVTFVKDFNGDLHYFVAYNQRLPYYILQRALARELGHIALRHDGSLTEEVRMTEALVFARHLLCPRPLIRAIQESGVPLTIETVGNLTGCYGRCLASMRKTPGAKIPAELNRKVKDQFSKYVKSFIAYQSVMASEDDSMIADFGTFMDNYVE